ncbi:hypothetical protein [Anderseniella sp. Alg231-50]|uniref:hypothetical protein n=1 Tax=Anderseniella sp. Alg231-50 TaxID=1922226 RepID=UPI000D54EBB2
MHAWIGFIFSCAMIIVAAVGKSGYQLVPGSIAATPAMEFMFLIGCAGFGAALAMLAPSYSTARLASLWSSAALAVVVLVINLDNLNLQDDAVRTVEPAVVVPEKAEAEEPKVDFVLKKTIHEGEWVPFSDLEHRIRANERSQPTLPANVDTHEPVPPPEPNPEQ